MQIIDTVGNKIIFKEKNGDYRIDGEILKSQSFYIRQNSNGETYIDTVNRNYFCNMSRDELFQFMRRLISREPFWKRLVRSKSAHYLILGSAGVSLFIYGFSREIEEWHSVKDVNKDTKPQELSAADIMERAREYYVKKVQKIGKKVVNGLLYTTPVMVGFGIVYLLNKK